MTPQEQQLVADLFDRLASLEGQRRDPDAERLIREGLGRAPNSVYALVQSVLVQDEALKRANAHRRRVPDGIRCVEGHMRIQVALVRRLDAPPHKLHQVGGRGLLSHDRQYPACPLTAALRS